MVMDGLVEELTAGARAEMEVVEEHGGAVEAVPYMKARLVESHRERVARIERGELKVIGQNSFTESRGLAADRRRRRRHPDPRPRGRARADRGARGVEGRAATRTRSTRPSRSSPGSPPTTARTSCRRRSPPPRRARPPASGRETLREVFGAYRGPTGVDGAAPPADREQLDGDPRARSTRSREQIGHRIKILVGKPGLDGHSNGAEQIALRARDVGMEVIYQGIRLTPEEIAESALQEDVDVVGLSILSGSHLELIPEVVRLLREEGVEVPVVVGGIIPAADAERLREAGVAGVYTPKDFDINRIMGEIVELVGRARRQPAADGLSTARRSRRAPDRATMER